MSPPEMEQHITRMLIRRSFPRGTVETPCYFVPQAHQRSRPARQDLLDIAQLLAGRTVGTVPVAIGHGGQRRRQAIQVVHPRTRLAAQELLLCAILSADRAVIIVLRT